LRKTSSLVTFRIRSQTCGC